MFDGFDDDNNNYTISSTMLIHYRVHWNKVIAISGYNHRYCPIKMLRGTFICIRLEAIIVSRQIFKRSWLFFRSSTGNMHGTEILIYSTSEQRLGRDDIIKVYCRNFWCYGKFHYYYASSEKVMCSYFIVYVLASIRAKCDRVSSRSTYHSPF